MNHRSTWGHPPRKPKPPRRGIPILFVIAVAMTLATVAAVLITGGR